MTEERTGWGGFALDFIDQDENLPSQPSFCSLVKVICLEEEEEDIISLYPKEKLQQIGDNISKCTNLQYLLLDSSCLSASSISALLGERTYQCQQLKSIGLKGGLDGNAFTLSQSVRAILPLLRASASTLVYLTLNQNNLDSDSAVQIIDALKWRSADNYVHIKELHLEHNRIGDRGMQHLLAAENSKYINKLCLHDNDQLKRVGRNAIFNFLKREGNAITQFGVDIKEAKYAKQLLESISNDSKLERFVMDCAIGTKSAKCVMLLKPVLQQLICNTTSFESLCESNHVLGDIGTHFYRYNSGDVDDAMEINARSECTINQRLRCKLKYYYFKGEFDIQPFIDLDVNLMPYLLGILTRTEVRAYDHYDDIDSERYFTVGSKDLNSVYRIVRSCHVPELFNFPSSEVRISLLTSETKELKESNAKLKAEISELKSRLSFPNKRMKQG